MDELILYMRLGLNHVLDFQAYDHILFLCVLVVAYSLKQWKEIIALVSLFTIGHTLTLFLAAYDIIGFNINLVEFLIPVTIFCTACLNVFIGIKTNVTSKIALFLSFCFGLIHGMGFSVYLKMLLSGSRSKFLPIVEFALGIEIAQLIIVAVLLVLFLFFNTLFKVSKRDWVLVISSIVIGIVIPMLANRYEAFIRVF